MEPADGDRSESPERDLEQPERKETEEGDKAKENTERRDEEREQEQGPEAVHKRQTVTNEYRNVRAIHGSASHINEATAGGHKPDLYHLSETWWEADTHQIGYDGDFSFPARRFSYFYRDCVCEGLWQRQSSGR
jgi:hypothetical protein